MLFLNIWTALERKSGRQFIVLHYVQRTAADCIVFIFECNIIFNMKQTPMEKRLNAFHCVKVKYTEHVTSINFFFIILY
jgi:hypothetical protein